MQCPDEVDALNGIKSNLDECYAWLMQFKDGNRLDLRIMPKGKEAILDDKLCLILLDKDNILPQIPKATDVDYRIKKPTQNEFTAACNEFWWCLKNVAKGLWREEIPYVHQMFYGAIHPEVVKLLNWKIGYETNFQVSTGKASKQMNHYLPDDIWQRFLKTYINGEIDDIWDSVYIMCDLFNEVAHELE